MAKKKLTVKQQQKKYRVLQFTCLGGEVLSVLTPFITLAIVNYESWFMTQDGWKVSLGGALALALMGIAIWLFTKKKEDNTITNGWITLIVGWFAVAFIFVLFASIIDQVASIMLWGGLGLAGAFGLDLVSNDMKTKANKLKELRKEVEDEKIKDQARVEEQ